jgi:hypothetical protein
VLPDQATGERCLALRDAGGQRQGAVQVARLAGGGVGGQHGLAGMHVGVLAAVGAELPLGRGLVGIQAVRGFPEALLHQLEGGGHAFAGAGHADVGRMGVGQQHEGQAVAVVGAIQHRGALLVPVQHPGVATLGLGMRMPHEGQGVGHVVHWGAEPAPGQRMVEHEAGAADEVPRAAVVDLAVVLEELEAAAARVHHPRRIEGQGVAHVGPQGRRLAEVGQGRCGHGRTSSFRKRLSSSAICVCTSSRGWAQAKALKR